MKRLPLFPTILVAGAVAVMIALGIWQLQRAEWKDRLVADYATAAAMPALDLDPLLGRDPASLPPLAFRRALISCNAVNVVPDMRGGRSADGRGGYAYLVPCRPGADGLAGRILVNVGWVALPEHGRRLSLGGIVAGRLGAVREGEPITLVSASAAPGLTPSAAPSIDEIPRNHRAYAVQWFAFALIALVIYLLALRARRSPPELPPEP
jgi:cytochrome oxidase assembly protein ShyY1